MEPECISKIIWVIITALLAGIFSVFILPWIKGKYFTFPKLKIDILSPLIDSVGESPRQKLKRIDPEKQTLIFDGSERKLIWAATWSLKITNKSKQVAYFSRLEIPQCSKYFKDIDLKESKINPTESITFLAEGAKRIEAKNRPDQEIYKSLKGLKVIIIYKDLKDRTYYTKFIYPKKNKSTWCKPKELKKVLSKTKKQ